MNNGLDRKIQLTTGTQTNFADDEFPADLLVELDRSRPRTLRAQLERGLRQAIAAQDARPGNRAAAVAGAGGRARAVPLARRRRLRAAGHRGLPGGPAGLRHPGQGAGLRHPPGVGRAGRLALLAAAARPRRQDLQERAARPGPVPAQRVAPALPRRAAGPARHAAALPAAARRARAAGRAHRLPGPGPRRARHPGPGGDLRRLLAGPDAAVPGAWQARRHPHRGRGPVLPVPPPHHRGVRARMRSRSRSTTRASRRRCWPGWTCRRCCCRPPTPTRAGSRSRPTGGSRCWSGRARPGRW